MREDERQYKKCAPIQYVVLEHLQSIQEAQCSAQRSSSVPVCPVQSATREAGHSIELKRNSSREV
jgi:hypothetical protein